MGLGELVHILLGTGPMVLVAEVLEPNPAPLEAENGWSWACMPVLAAGSAPRACYSLNQLQNRRL
jgi:hypothetical protein